MRALFALLILTVGILNVQWPSATATSFVSRPSPADAFVDSVGFNVHLSYTTSCYQAGYEVFKKIFLSLGHRHARDGMIPNMASYYYDNMNELGRGGVGFQLIVANGTAASIISSYHTLVLDAFERYEGPNEVDLNFPKTYATDAGYMARVLWNAHNPAYKVVGTSLTTIEAYAAVGNLSAWVDYG